MRYILSICLLFFLCVPSYRVYTCGAASNIATHPDEYAGVPVYKIVKDHPLLSTSVVLGSMVVAGVCIHSLDDGDVGKAHQARDREREEERDRMMQRLREQHLAYVKDQQSTQQVQVSEQEHDDTGATSFQENQDVQSLIDSIEQRLYETFDPAEMPA